MLVHAKLIEPEVIYIIDEINLARSGLLDLNRNRLNDVRGVLTAI